MRKVRLAVLLSAVLVLAACGGVPPTSKATETPSPTPAISPTAAPTPLTIPGPTFHMGEVGLAYTPVTYQATGGNDPFLWIVSDGALPGGLAISLDGVVSGTPTASGNFTFTVEVTDASTATAHVSGSISIASRLTLHYVGVMAAKGQVTVCTVPSSTHCYPGQADDVYAPFAALSGGEAPYTFSVLSGTLPPGMRLNGLALAGTFPAQAQGVYRFTVTVTDSLGATATIVAVYSLYYSHNIVPVTPTP